MGFFFLFWQYRNKCSETWIVKMNNQSVCYRRLFVMSSFTKTIRGNICDRVPSSPWTAACRAASTRPWPFAESSGPVSGPSCTACLPWTPASTFQRLLGLTSQMKYLLTNLRSHIIYLCWLFNIELFCLICEFRYTPHLVCRLSTSCHRSNLSHSSPNKSIFPSSSTDSLLHVTCIVIPTELNEETGGLCLCAASQ